MEKVNVKAKCANQQATLLHCYHVIVLNKNTYSEPYNNVIPRKPITLWRCFVKITHQFCFL